jgi:hypothetical protein
MGNKRSKKTGTWWQPATVAVGEQLICQLGPLTLAIGHGEDEWALHCSNSTEDQAPGQASFKTLKGLPETIDERFVHAGDSNQVSLSPLLADRPVVIRPRQPVFLLSGQTITLYLSTPVWIRIMVGDPPVLLKELPALRLSDTWFGPNTREGELCYAGRTHARHDPGELPDRPHRAITPLTICNKAPSPLPLEKISLPAPMLALYGDTAGKLWTQAVTLTREGHSDLASVRIDNKLPDNTDSLTRLAEPRQEPGRSGVTRAFSLLFGD